MKTSSQAIIAFVALASLNPILANPASDHSVQEAADAVNAINKKLGGMTFNSREEASSDFADVASSVQEEMSISETNFEALGLENAADQFGVNIGLPESGSNMVAVGGAILLAQGIQFFL